MTHTWLIWLTHNVMLSKHDSAWQRLTRNAVRSVRTLYDRCYRALWLVTCNTRIQYLLYVVMDTLVCAQHCKCINTGPYGSVQQQLLLYLLLSLAPWRLLYNNCLWVLLLLTEHRILRSRFPNMLWAPRITYRLGIVVLFIALSWHVKAGRYLWCLGCFSTSSALYCCLSILSHLHAYPDPRVKGITHIWVDFCPPVSARALRWVVDVK